MNLIIRNVRDYTWGEVKKSLELFWISVAKDIPNFSSIQKTVHMVSILPSS